MARRLLKVGATVFLAVVSLAAQTAASAPYPEKPIRLIVPTVPGSPPDVVARLLGTQLTLALGQAIVVENRPGAIGTIGLDAVARAAPDGYTLGAIAMPYIVATELLPNVPYNTERDLAPVALVARNYMLLAVPESAGIRSVGDIVAKAKSHPGTLKYSSNGNGTPPHLAGELFKRETRIELVHIPYKGAVAGVAALLAGDVDLTFGAVQTLSPHVKSGKLRAIATAAPQRLPGFPDVPTMVELGYASVDISDWQGIVAPAATPKDVIARLHHEIAKVLALPETRERLKAMGMQMAVAGPEEFSAHLRREVQRWGKLVRDLKITAD